MKRAAMALPALLALAGCRVILGGDEFTDAPPPPGEAPASIKIDLLLDIQNSRGMADKQKILQLAIPDLVSGLVNPPCVTAAGYRAAEQPSDPSLPCPTPGTTRGFEPVRDIHIGMITSSLGGHGANSCSLPEENDRGHLVARSAPVGGRPVGTYQDLGFLVWDPDAARVPPGTANAADLIDKLSEMSPGPGAIGCGLESQLESWYRFLVDPEPYDTISAVDTTAIPQGLDEALLAQRASFLRPDSLLVIIMLADQNDCSIREEGPFYLAGQIYQGGSPFHLPPGRAECAADPNDPCCKSCGQPSPECEPDPTCADPLPEIEDSINIRCFDQKRRFGIDFLYPVARYVDALTAPMVVRRDGSLADNPIFAGGARTAEDIFLVGIVGVPWHDIARRDPAGKPNMLQGLDANGEPVGGFQSAAELVASGTWGVIVGDPANYVPPGDPLMIESIDARMGSNPITGDALAPPDAADAKQNPINGHERVFAQRDDLQYACIFDLPEPTDCDAVEIGCPCAFMAGAETMNPVCQDEAGEFTSIQRRAGAFPGIRQLALLQALGDQGIVGSICPKQVNDPTLSDFGYRPVIQGLVERLKGASNAAP